MAKFDLKSLKAEEFISNEEILDTLEYARANKNNIELIDSILDKARPVKTENGYVCHGLSHREASVLLECDIEEKVQEIYKIAEEIKLADDQWALDMFKELWATYDGSYDSVTKIVNHVLGLESHWEVNLLQYEEVVKFVTDAVYEIVTTSTREALNKLI